MIHSFLMIGQSNMAGRGFLNEAEPIAKDVTLRVLRNGRWQRLYRPINPDRVTSGYSLGESFAEEYARDHGVEVGIIPCADGGTSLEQWSVGGLLYDNAVFNAKQAMRTSHLVAIIWHQGESDCQEPKYETYCERLIAMMTELRRELGDEDIPIVVGGLGDFLSKRAEITEKPHFKNYVYVNRELERFAETFPRTAFASAEGLLANPDELHFSTAALKEFGQRYYKAFLTVEDRSKMFFEEGKTSDTERTEIELL